MEQGVVPLIILKGRNGIRVLLEVLVELVKIATDNQLNGSDDQGYSLCVQETKRVRAKVQEIDKMLLRVLSL